MPHTPPSEEQPNAEAESASPSPEPPTPETITEEPGPSVPPQIITLEDMQLAKVHPLPEPADLKIQSYVGEGYEGIVYKGKMHNDTRVAIKVFWDSQRPTDVGWPFEEECRTVARLQMLRQGMKIATDHGRGVRVKTEPKNEWDMTLNTFAFCTESCPSLTSSKAGAESSDKYTTLTEFPPLPRCYGWVRIKGETLDVLPKFPIDPHDFHYALVYDYMPDGRNPAVLDIMQKQLHFFYLTGIQIEEYKEDNWRNGILVDMNDLACVAGPYWGAGYVVDYDVMEYLGDKAKSLVDTKQ